MSRIKDYYDFIIVGACRAGLTAAQTIREQKPEASILIVNGEDRPPYKRTDLSKYLSSGFTREEFTLYDVTWYKDNRIDLLDDTVLSVEPGTKTLKTLNGIRPGWGSLLLSTGAVPSVPSLKGSPLLTHLRTAEDAETIRAKLSGKKQVLILGQGVEGIELAEQCSLMGLHVTLTGRDDRLMKRWLDTEQSRRLRVLMESRGVDLHFDQHIEEVRKDGDRYSLISREQTLAGDLILSSTGIKGNPVLAEDLGIYGDRGILTDLYCRTGLPGIFAAGDVVQLPAGWPGGLWHWSEHHGKTAALNMCGIPAELTNSPSRLKSEPFGSFYYSMSFQTVLESDRSIVFRNDDRLYLRLFSRDNQSIAALMTGLGKAESKILDGGIKSGMPPETLAEAVFKAAEKKI